MSMSESDRNLYQFLMFQIRERVSYAARLLSPTPTYRAPVETAAMQLRKVLELVLFSSLERVP